MKNKYVLGVDIGGSHIACQVVDLGSYQSLEDTYTEVKVAETESAQQILAAWNQALKACIGKAGSRSIEGIGVAIPSPFDFIAGIAMADHKFASLKGMNIRNELSKITGVDAHLIRFTNDAAAFGMGAWRINGSGDSHLIGVTLGTGFGACFIVDGCYATYGPGVPIGGELWNYPFRGQIAEDFVSTRWFEQRFAEVTGIKITGVKPMIDYYRQGQYTVAVKAIFDQFARSFAEIMLPFLVKFRADVLVMGGGMVLSEEFFIPQIKQYLAEQGVEVSLCTQPDTTASIIVGAAALCE